MIHAHGAAAFHSHTAAFSHGRTALERFSLDNMVEVLAGPGTEIDFIKISGRATLVHELLKDGDILAVARRDFGEKFDWLLVRIGRAFTVKQRFEIEPFIRRRALHIVGTTANAASQSVEVIGRVLMLCRLPPKQI